jgi:hypothetical protein
MIDGAYVLKKKMDLPFGIKFSGGKEIVISNGVVCVDGFPLPADMQSTIMKWLDENQINLVKTRSW